MHALLIGATGATGKDLLNLLLTDDAFQKVDVFARRKLDVQHPKLTVHLIDFDKPDEWGSLIKADVLFSCLGTTLKAAGSKEAQWKIDYDYQFNFAKAARENNVPCYILVSSALASPGSAFFYTKMKGQLEEAVKALGFAKLHIFQPPTLVRKNSDRGGEVIGVKVIKFFNKLGLFRAQKPMPTETLSRAMINTAKANTDGAFIHSPQEIWELAR